jgi:hypothetical protein
VDVADQDDFDWKMAVVMAVKDRSEGIGNDWCPVVRRRPTPSVGI